MDVLDAIIIMIFLHWFGFPWSLGGVARIINPNITRRRSPLATRLTL